MVDLLFGRIASVVAIAALGAKDNKVTQFFMNEGVAVIRFSEYVKSQVHLNVVSGLFERSLKEYVEALRFIGGERIYQESAECVLRYFYADLANFLINNTSNVLLNVVVDTDYFDLPKVEYCIASETEKFKQSIAEFVNNGSDNCACSEVLDYVDGIEDLNFKIESYALALALKEQSEQSELRIFESR